MAALVPTIPVNSGVVVTPGNVAASDTIDQAVMGPKGAYLKIINGNASPDNVTISDAGVTPAQNPLSPASVAKTVANATAQIFNVRREQVNLATGLVTVTNSVTTTVTYELYPY